MTQISIKKYMAKKFRAKISNANKAPIKSYIKTTV